MIERVSEHPPVLLLDPAAGHHRLGLRDLDLIGRHLRVDGQVSTDEPGIRTGLRLMQQVVLLDTATKLIASAAEVRRAEAPPTAAQIAAVDQRLEDAPFEPFCSYAARFADRSLDLSTAAQLDAVGLSALRDYVDATRSPAFRADIALLTP